MKSRLAIVAAVVVIAAGPIVACSGSGPRASSNPFGSGSTTSPTTSGSTTSPTTSESTTSPSSEPTNSETSVASQTVPARVWADNFCRSLSAWEQTLKDEPNPPGGVQGAKDALVGYLQKVDGATGDLITTLTEVGTPDIPQGSASVNAFVKDLDSARSLFQQALDEARNLPTNDIAAFQSQTRSLSNDLKNGSQRIGNSISNLDKRYPASGEALNGLMSSVPSCKAMH